MPLHYRWYGLLLAIMLGLFWPGSAMGARPEAGNQPDPRTRTFPHISWGANYAGGKPRVLFIVAGSRAWSAYALAMRMELDFDVFYTTGWDVAPKTDYWGEGIMLYPQALTELRALVQKPWDVIVLGNQSPYGLPGEIQYLLLEQAAKGTGIVSNNDWRRGFGTAKAIKVDGVLPTLPLSALSLPSSEQKDTLAFGSVATLLPASFRETVKSLQPSPPLMYQIGKGRLITVDGLYGAPVINWGIPQDPDDLLQTEYGYSYTAKLVLLAAGREPAVRLGGLDADGKTFAPAQPITISSKLSANFTGDAHVVVRTPRNEVVYDKTSPVTADAGTLTVALPGLPAGRYYVDVWLLREKKTVDWASASFTVQSPTAKISDLTLAKFSLAADENVVATATVTGMAQGVTVTARIRDANYRVLVEKTGIPIVNGKAAVSLPLTRTREVYHTLEVALVQGKMQVDSRTQRFFVPRTVDNDLVVFSDAGADRDRFSVFRDYGINSVQAGDEGGACFPNLAVAGGFHPDFRIWRSGCDQFIGGCISSKTYLQATRDSFASVMASQKPYGLSFFSVGDDSGVSGQLCNSYPNWVRSFVVKMGEKYKGDLTAFLKEHNAVGKWGRWIDVAWQCKLADFTGLKLAPGDFEIMKSCWKENYATIEEFNRASNTNFKSFDEITEADVSKIQQVSPCLLAFRDAMKARYTNIAALNAAWETQLGSFEEITEPLVEGLPQQGKYGAKLDKTWFLEDLFINSMAAVGKGVHSVAPDVGVGMGAASFTNVIPETLEGIDSSMPYQGDLDIEMIRSLPHRYCGWTIGTYGGATVKPPARVYSAWQTVFSGGNFIWFWTMSNGLEGDLSLNPNRAGVMLDTIKEMQTGVARALIHGKRLHDGIAILQERRASSLSGVLKEFSTVGSSQVAVQNIIEDLGMQYRYTWTKEVENGVLRTGEFKVLFLPYTQTLTNKEAAEIRAFVQNGGTVIADLRVATRDWNGKPLAAGQLDDVFGIKQQCTAAKPVKGEMTWTLQADGTALTAPATIPDIRADASVSAGTARPLAKIGDTPVMLVNSFGKGHAVFLNQATSTYNKFLSRGTERDLRALYRSLFALGGSARRFAVVRANVSDISGAEIAVFRNGPIQYLTLAKKSYECEKYPMQGFIKLDAVYDVYDARAGKKIGRTDSIPVTLTGLGCYVYSLLPYTANGFTAQLPAQVKPGQDATLSIALAVKGGQPGPHTIRVDVFRPNGERLWPMNKFELQDGKAKLTLPIAYNEEPGAWKVTVTDVTTGAVVEKTMRVSK